MRGPILLTLLLLFLPAGLLPVGGQEPLALEARIWVDRGEQPVLEQGDPVRIYYRTSDRAYVAIFRIDTDGRVSLLFPQHPEADPIVEGNIDYRLLLPEAPVWVVRDDPGVGYLFMVASPQPLDFSVFRWDPRTGWDLGAVGDVVYEDPYVAIDAYVAALIPNWEEVPYALDFVTYDVGEGHDYPRFLCYDCHGYRPYQTWNPYRYTCATYRVVIWDDPYFYPAYRYVDTHVVFVQPARALPRYELRPRSVAGIGTRPLVLARAAPERRPQFKEPAAAIPASAGPERRTARPLAAPQEAPRTGRQVPPRAGGQTPQEAPRTGQQAPPDTGRSRPTLQRRPSSTAPRLPVRTPPPTGGPTGGGDAPDRGGRSAEPRRTAPSRAPSSTPERPTPQRPSSTRGRVAPAPPAQGEPRGAERPSARVVPAPRTQSSDRPAVTRAPRREATPPVTRGRAQNAPARSAPAPRPQSPPARSAPAPRPQNPPARTQSPPARSAPSTRSAPQARPAPSARSSSGSGSGSSARAPSTGRQAGGASSSAPARVRRPG